MAGKIMSLALQIEGKLNSTFTRSAKDAARGLEDVGAAGKKAHEDARKAAKDYEAQLDRIAKASSKVQGSFRNLGTNLTAPLKTVAASAAAAGAAVYGVTTVSAMAGDKVAKTSAKVGLSTEAYGRLAHAANMSGVAEDAFASSTIRLNKTIADAAQGSKSAKLAFERAGISIKDAKGNIRPTEDILLELSDVMAKMPEGIYKADLAMHMMGKSGADMVPLLQSGRKSIEEMGNEADKLGLLWSKDEAVSAEGYMDSLTRVGQAFKGLGNTVSKEAFPIMTDLHNEFADGIASLAPDIGKKVAGLLGTFKENLPTIKEDVRATTQNIKLMWDKVDKVAQSMGGWDKVLKNLAITWAGFKAAKIGWSLVGVTQSTIGLGKAVFAAGPAFKAMSMNASRFALPALKGVHGGFRLSGKAAKGFGRLLLEPDRHLLSMARNIRFDSIPTIRRLGSTVKGSGVSSFQLLGNVTKSLAKAPFKMIAGGFRLVTGALHLMKVAVLTNPITAAIAGIAAGAYIIYDNWSNIDKYFRDKIGRVTAAFDEGFLVAIPKALLEFHPAVLLFDGIDGMVHYLTGIDLKGIFSTQLNAAKEYFSKFDLSDETWKIVRSIGKALGSFNPLSIFIKRFGEVSTYLRSIDFKAIGQGLALDLINGIGEYIPFGSTVADLLGFSAPSVPQTANASGGLVAGRRLSMLGEGGPEMVVPLNRPERARDLLAQAASMIGGLGGNGGSQSVTFSPRVDIHISGDGDPATIKRAVEDALSNQQDNFRRMFEEMTHQQSRVSMS